MYFLKKSGRSATLPPPFLLGFTAIADHQGVGEVLPGYGPQSSTAPFRIPISFLSRAAESEGSDGFSVVPPLSLFLNG
jgi:hypothetical protein